MYLEIFLADFAVFRVFLGISRDFAEIPEFRGSATARNLRSPVETKNRTLKCLKWHYLTVRSMKNVAVLTEEGAFALFFRPHPGGFDSSRVPTPRNLPSKAKKMLMPGGQRPRGRGGGQGAGGIDWCIDPSTTTVMLSLNFNPACVLLLVCSLHFTHSLHCTPGLQSAVCILHWPIKNPWVLVCPWNWTHNILLCRPALYQPS